MVAAVAAVLVVLGACSNDDQPALGPSSSTGSTRSEASSAPPSTLTTTIAPVCDGPSVPTNAPQLTTITADFDGDGADDTLRVYSAGANAPYHVNVELGSSKGVVDIAIADTISIDDRSAPRALGSAEISGADGTGAEAFVSLIPGASTRFVSIYQVVGCTLVPLARSDNRSVQFGIGGSVTHQGGLRCTSDGINVFAATSSDGVDYETSEEHLAVQDHTLVPASPPSTGTVNASDPSFASFGVFDCGDVPQP